MPRKPLRQQKFDTKLTNYVRAVLKLTQIYDKPASIERIDELSKQRELVLDMSYEILNEL